MSAGVPDTRTATLPATERHVWPAAVPQEPSLICCPLKQQPFAPILPSSTLGTRPAPPLHRLAPIAICACPAQDAFCFFSWGPGFGSLWSMRFSHPSWLAAMLSAYGLALCSPCAPLQPACLSAAKPLHLIPVVVCNCKRPRKSCLAGSKGRQERGRAAAKER